MSVLVTLLLAVSALALCVSDFRYRTVSSVSLLLYSLSAVLYGFVVYGVYVMLMYAVIGGGMSLVLFGFICLYFRIREGKGSKVIDVKIGKGDLYFFLPSSLLFEPLSLMLFYVASGMSGLAYHVASGKDDIPLIGISVPSIILHILISQFL